jgi:hypothetical protein
MVLRYPRSFFARTDQKTFSEKNGRFLLKILHAYRYKYRKIEFQGKNFAMNLKKPAENSDQSTEETLFRPL